jgi:hypothetical protein
MNSIRKAFQWLVSSFDTDTKGASARKLSGFAAVITAIYITVKELPQESQLHALYAWLAFALVCLGIVTIEQIIRFKNGNSNTPANSEQASRDNQPAGN